MVMEFDQYLQPCDVIDSRYLAIDPDGPLSRTPLLPRLDVRRVPAGVDAGSPRGEIETVEAAAAPGSAVSPSENRCLWECNFDNDDAETILTSETVGRYISETALYQASAKARALACGSRFRRSIATRGYRCTRTRSWYDQYKAANLVVWSSVTT